MITKVDNTKCNGCGVCFGLCNMDVLRLDTNQEELPPCRLACPAGVDMRVYMYLMKMRQPDAAIKVMREANPMPAITGRVCFHPCETDCARKDVDEAVSINAIERYLADYWLKERAKPVPIQHIVQVAVVGSGPAGLSAAYFLTGMGYPVTVYESENELGGMLRYGIPEYRLPRKILDAQIRYIKDSGVVFKTGVAVGKDIGLMELQRKYRAIFLAPGAPVAKRLKVEGSNLEGVAWGLEFLKQVNTGQKTPINGAVVVIGGGDVAMDVALTALRLGAKQVDIACLESREQMPAHAANIHHANEEGIRINNSWGPRKITGKDGKVSGVELVRCMAVFDEKGNFSPLLDESVSKMLPADRVILAVGQAADLTLLPKELKAGAGTITVEKYTLQTSIDGVFAGGDAVSGPASVIEAFAAGKRAATAIHRFVQGLDMNIGRDAEIKKVPEPPGNKIKKVTRTAEPVLELKDRKNFKEVCMCYSDEAAEREVNRCMTCGSRAVITYPEDCMVCFNCELQCPCEAIDVAYTPVPMPPMIKIAKGGKNG